MFDEVACCALEPVETLADGTGGRALTEVAKVNEQARAFLDAVAAVPRMDTQTVEDN